MRKSDLAIRLARDARLSPAQAADHLDHVVHDILKNVRDGKEASLPGLGRFLQDDRSRIRFEKTIRPERNKRS